MGKRRANGMADSRTAIAYALGNEGGYSNNPNDPGGPTKYGICHRDHPSVDIKNLTVEQAYAIYKNQYWCYDGLQNQTLASKLLDWAINLEGTGVHGEAVRALQQAINLQYSGVLNVDATFGPNTVFMANKCNPQDLVTAMVKIVQTYRAHLIDANPKLSVFADGWKTRDEKMPPSTDGATVLGEQEV